MERQNPADTVISEEGGGGAVLEGLHLVGMTHARAVHEELQPMGRTHAGFRRTVSCGRDSMLEQEKSVRSCPEKEGGAETACGELSPAPISNLPVLLEGRR